MGFESHRIQETDNVNIKAGQFFEQAIFKGCVDDDFDVDNGYMEYKESLAWAKDHQPKKDYNNPETLDSEQLSQLKSAVSSKLTNVDEVLRFYTAIGSPLDVLHGVDGFFEIGNHIVTLDLTLNSDKIIAKADVVILADDENGMTNEIIELAANSVVDKFKEKMIHDKKLH